MALVAVRKAMDYLFSQHDLSFLDDVIPEKDKKKKEDEKKKKKKKGSLDSDNEDVRPFLPLLTYFDALMPASLQQFCTFRLGIGPSLLPLTPPIRARGYWMLLVSVTEGKARETFCPIW